MFSKLEKKELGKGLIVLLGLSFNPNKKV